MSDHLPHSPSDDPSGGDPSATGTALTIVIGAIITVAIIVALVALFYNVSNAEYEKKVVAVVPEELTHLRSEQLARLHTYRWVNQREGQVAIPIERAMELIIAERAGGTQGP